jgi:hypothetical protein
MNEAVEERVNTMTVRHMTSRVCVTDQQNHTGLSVRFSTSDIEEATAFGIGPKGNLGYR